MTARSGEPEPRPRLPRFVTIFIALYALGFLVLAVWSTVLNAWMPAGLLVLYSISNIGMGVVIAAIAVAGYRARPTRAPGINRAAFAASPALIPPTAAAGCAWLDDRYGIATTGPSDALIGVVLLAVLTAVLAKGPRSRLRQLSRR